MKAKVDKMPHDGAPAFLMVGINARYSHTNIAIRYLAQALKMNGFQADILEESINIPYGQLLRKIANVAKGHDVIAFSTYIWNIEIVRDLLADLHQLYPEKIWMAGGPEVSYEPHVEFARMTGADLILAGEGEEAIVALAGQLYPFRGKDKTEFLASAAIDVPGVFTARGVSDGNLPKEAFPVIKDLSVLAFPYGEDEPLDNRILYYESSRGCPYNCSYCLSSTLKGVRFKPLESVFGDMDWFIAKKVMQVKFVDRTFNADRDRTHSLLSYIISKDNGFTQFHFELTAALIDEAMLNLLANVRPGLFQFELGIQTTNAETSKEIHRTQPLELTLERCRKLVVLGRQHIHMDLIAGLPYDTATSFEAAMDRCFTVAPHMLQIGFLKLLKGSEIRIKRDKYGYIHSQKAPYEVMSSNTLSFDELQEIKKIEEVVDRFYNSGIVRLPIRLIGILLQGEYTGFLKKVVAQADHEGCFDRQVKTEEWLELIRTVAGSEFESTGIVSSLMDFMDRQAARFGVPGAVERLGSQDPDFRRDVFQILHDSQPYANHPIIGKLPVKDQFKKINAIMTKCDGDILEKMLESDKEPDRDSLMSILKDNQSICHIELIDKTAKHPFTGMYPIVKVSGIQSKQE